MTEMIPRSDQMADNVDNAIDTHELTSDTHTHQHDTFSPISPAADMAGSNQATHAVDTPAQADGQFGTVCSHPIQIQLTDLSLTLQTHNLLRSKVKSSKKVLHHLTGSIKPGRLLGIMGGSGSGKTTLINILANRFDTSTNKLDGTVAFNGRERQTNSQISKLMQTNNADKQHDILLTQSIGYVLQTDNLLPHLTTRETLRYAALLRLPPSMSNADKYERVEQVIMELGLKGVADTQIGNELKRGLSGGEKRRVSVAVQMLTDPSILFLDEPTTGLDSFTALNLIQTLTKLASQNRTVVCTIHQPRSAIFNLMDDVLLLSKGRCVYWSDRNAMYDYFSTIQYHCPNHTNPADYFVDVASFDARNQQSRFQSRQRVKQLVEHWNANPRSRPATPVATVTRISVHSPSERADLKAATVQASGASFLTQVRILTHRAIVDLLRDRVMLIGFFVETVFVAIAIGLIFLDLPITIPGLRSRYGLVYLLVSVQPYLILIFSIYYTCQQMRVYDVEAADNMYSPAAYMLSRTLAQLPVHILFPLIFNAIVYYMVGLRDGADHWWAIYGITALCQYTNISFAYLAAAINRQFAGASLIANSFYTFAVLSAGYVVQTADLPTWIGWMRFLSFVHYGFQAELVSEFGDRQFVPDSPSQQYLQTGYDPNYDGNYIIDTTLALSVNNDYTVPIVVLCAFVVAWQLLALMVLQLFPLQPAIGDISTNANEDDELAVNKSPAAVKSSTVSPVAAYDSSSSSPSHSELVKPSVDVMIDMPTTDMVLTDPQMPIKRIISARSQRRAVTVHVNRLSVYVNKTVGNTSRVKPTAILNNIDCVLEPAQLYVLMGASGSGKTTLLNTLAGRMQANAQYERVGSVTFNGDELDKSSWTSICGYCVQADHLLPCLTVYETLNFAAQLRLPKSVGKQQRHDRVIEVISELGLRDCMDTRIGNEIIRGISGGEKRRVSIAVQLLTDPAVLYLDEPTSGLDSNTASHVMHTLKRIACRGRTVVCSIHQPASTVYALFDHIILLAQGKIVYNSTPDGTIDYFGALHLTCPHRTNPADWILDISSIDYRSITAEQETKQRVALLIDTYKQQHRSAQPQGATDNDSIDAKNASLQATERSRVSAWMTIQARNLVYAVSNTDSSGVHLNNADVRQPAVFTVAFVVLLKRALLNYSRNIGLASTRIWQILAFAVILALFYTNRIGRQQSDVINILGMIQEYSALLFTGMLNAIAFFPTERNTFYREAADRTYGTAAFFLSYAMIEMVMEAVAALLFTALTVLAIGLKSDVTSYFLYSLLSFCLINAGESLGIIFCSIVYQPGISVSITNVVLSMFTLTCGIFSLTEVGFIRGIDHISIIHYSTRSMLVHEFEGRTFDCGALPVSQCAFPTGESVIDYESYQGEDVILNMGLTIVFAGIYRLMAYIALSNSARTKSYAQ